MGVNQSVEVGEKNDKVRLAQSSAKNEAVAVQRVLKDANWIWVNDMPRAEPAHAVSEKTPVSVSRTREPEALSLATAEEWQTTLLKDPKARCISGIGGF
jgi:hypothetical protein